MMETIEKIEESTKEVRQVTDVARMPTKVRGRPRLASSVVGPSHRWGAKVSTHASGRIAEIYAALDLMRRGYDVFSPLHWSTLCDLLIVHRNNAGHAPVRVEVKFAYRTKDGRLGYPKPKMEFSDLLAIVCSDGSVEYRATSNLEIEITPEQVLQCRDDD